MLFAAVLAFASLGQSSPLVPDRDGVVPEDNPLDKLSIDRLVSGSCDRRCRGSGLGQIQERPLRHRQALDKLAITDLVTARCLSRS